MPDPQANEELELMRAQAKRVRREATILVQMVAQFIEDTAAPTSTAEEAHETDERRGRSTT